MVVKSFIFRKNWAGSKVAGIKTTFLQFLTQPGPIFWSKMALIRIEHLNILIFNQLERQKLYWYQFYDLKTD